MWGLIFAVAMVAGFWPLLVLMYIVVLLMVAIWVVLPNVYGEFAVRPTPVAKKLWTVFWLFVLAEGLAFFLMYLDWPQMGRDLFTQPTTGFMWGSSLSLVACLVWVLAAQTLAVAGRKWELALPPEEDLDNFLGNAA